MSDITEELLDRYARRLKAKLDHLLVAHDDLQPKQAERQTISTAYTHEKQQDWRYSPHPSEGPTKVK